MTEEEAKTKWCPHVRVRYDGDPVAVNMQHSDWASDEKRPKCIASDCMMWVQDTSYWAKDGRRIPTESDEFNNYLTPEDGGFETVCEGHCGLSHGK